MTVTVNTEPCWIVTDADGSPTGFEDSEPHYATEDEANKVALDITSPGDPAPVVKVLDHLCASATAACGYTYDEDDEGVQHWPDSADAFREYLTGTADWRTGTGETLLCPVAHRCDECDAIAIQPLDAELPGQMRIGEVER